MDGVKGLFHLVSRLQSGYLYLFSYSLVLCLSAFQFSSRYPLKKLALHVGTRYAGNQYSLTVWKAKDGWHLFLKGHSFPDISMNLRIVRAMD